MLTNRPPKRLQHLPELLLNALEEQSEGDWRRVTVDADGTVVVHNQPQIVRVELEPEGTTAQRMAESGQHRPRSGRRRPSQPPMPTPSMPWSLAPPARSSVVGAPPIPRFEPPGPARPASPSPTRKAPAVSEIPRHPRLLKKQLRAMGAQIGEAGPDGRALVTYGGRTLGRVMVTDYRTPSAAAEWKAMLAIVEDASVRAGA